MKLHALFALLILGMCACTEPKKDEVSQPPKVDTTQKTTSINKPPTSPIKTLVFGTFSGMCMGDCAPMFQLEVPTQKLARNTGDEFFRSKDSLNFDTDLSTQPAKVEAAQEVLEKLPKVLLGIWAKGRYGCPDCKDGGGVYIRLHKHNGGVRAFFIDPHLKPTNDQEREIVAYAHFIRAKVKQLLKATPDKK
jgi:hypothetical protein